MSCLTLFNVNNNKKYFQKLSLSWSWRIRSDINDVFTWIHAPTLNQHSKTSSYSQYHNVHVFDWGKSGIWAWNCQIPHGPGAHITVCGSWAKVSKENIFRVSFPFNFFPALFFFIFYLTFINIFHQICPELKLSPCDLEVFIPQVHLFLYFTGNFQKKKLFYFPSLRAVFSPHGAVHVGLKVRQQVWRCSPDTISVLFIYRAGSRWERLEEEAGGRGLFISWAEHALPYAALC